MKTFKIYTITLLLILLSNGMTAQYLIPFSDKPANSGQAGYTINSDCKAGFTYEPDSLTSTPFLYHFKDISTGNINAWHWDFGDGIQSAEQNPSHRYEKAGTYEVCLTIADLNDTSTCFDKTCLALTTLEYFSLGGLVYAGEYPLNNPVMAGDTGIASLYRIVDNQIVFVEDQYFQEYGYYWFGYLFPGDYMLKIALTEGSTHFRDYFTTYFGDHVSWTKADLIKISDASLYEAEIHLLPVQELQSGTGIIRGYVNFEQDGPIINTPPIAQTNVILADKDHNPLLFIHPNNTGYFEFSALPFDSYFLSADATGKPASAINITLSENAPVVEGINLTIFGSNANFIREGFSDGIYLTRIYPNPVRENLHISLYSGITAPIGIKIMDVNGKIYFSTAGKFEPGFNEIRVPTDHLPAGLYLLIMQPQGNYLPITSKFVK